jgi:hypothetical protein
MKKVKAGTADELRPEYNRSDFGELVRGKYAVPPVPGTVYLIQATMNNSLTFGSKASAHHGRRAHSQAPRGRPPL